MFECQSDTQAHFSMSAPGMSNMVTHKESTMHEHEAETGVGRANTSPETWQKLLQGSNSGLKVRAD